MEQRKLMLPAFHGEKMARLSGLMAEVPIARWPAGPKADRAASAHAAPHPRDHPPGSVRARPGRPPRCPARGAGGNARVRRSPDQPGCRRRRTASPPRLLERVGPFASFVRLQQKTDKLLFELIEERRAEGQERERHPRDAAGGATRGRLADVQEEIRDELLTLLVAGHETTASSLAWRSHAAPPSRGPGQADRGDRRRGGRRVPDGDDPGDPPSSAGAAKCGPALGHAAARGRRVELPDRCMPGTERLPDPPRSGDLSGPVRLPPGAVPRPSRPAPTRGFRSAAVAGAAWAPASQWSR